MLKYIALFAILLLPSCVRHENKTPTILNMSYHDARNVILRSGWTPAQNMPPYNEIGAGAHYFRDLGYAEVYDCSGAGILRCTFYFQNQNGKYLKIGTEGEYNDPRYDVQTFIISAQIRDQINIKSNWQQRVSGTIQIKDGKFINPNLKWEDIQAK
jgi:hypothetical protein